MDFDTDYIWMLALGIIVWAAAIIFPNFVTFKYSNYIALLLTLFGVAFVIIGIFGIAINILRQLSRRKTETT